jgi:hypothetical protein
MNYNYNVEIWNCQILYVNKNCIIFYTKFSIWQRTFGLFIYINVYMRAQYIIHNKINTKNKSKIQIQKRKNRVKDQRSGGWEKTKYINWNVWYKYKLHNCMCEIHFNIYINATYWMNNEWIKFYIFIFVLFVHYEWIWSRFSCSRFSICIT